MKIIRSTADLNYSGLAGYRKGIVAGLAALVTILSDIDGLLPVEWQPYVQAVVAIAGAVLVVMVPNDVSPDEIALGDAPPDHPADDVPPAA